MSDRPCLPTLILRELFGHNNCIVCGTVSAVYITCVHMRERDRDFSHAFKYLCTTLDCDWQHSNQWGEAQAGMESLPWYVRVWQTTALVSIHIALYEMKGNLNTEDITAETSCGRSVRPNNAHCLLAYWCVSMFSHVFHGNDSYAPHTLFCQIDGSIGMPPVSLKTGSKRRHLNKEWEKNKRGLINHSPCRQQIYHILAGQHTVNRFKFIDHCFYLHTLCFV